MYAGGDPLEIYTDRDGEVIFKKYSPMGELGSFVGELAEALSRKVKIAPAGEGGTLSLEFYSKEDLSRLAEALSRRS